MITLKDNKGESENWKSKLRKSYLSWDALLRYLQIESEDLKSVSYAEDPFPFRVTRQYASRIEKGNLKDPLLMQIIPSENEKIFDPFYTEDPVSEIGDKHHSNLLIHKYSGRALMIATGSCAIHCRYCFRRHFPYSEKIGHQKTLRALDELKKKTDVNELIVSGGDPLILDDSKIEKILKTVSTYKHIKRVRFHTRVPIVFPQRITQNFLNLAKRYSSLLVMVTHINHPNEIDCEVGDVINELREQKVLLLNQSVLLKGVNDSINTLLELSDKLFEIGILPYYIHMLDKVAGATHYDVPRPRAKYIQSKLQDLLPAYLVPRFVEEIPGKPSKIPI